MNTLFAIRCYQYTAEVEDLYRTLTGIAEPDSILVAIDQTNDRTSIPAHIRYVNIDSAKLQRLGLRQIPKWGWQCGDYFYYAIANEHEADFYWLIEPDVLFGGNIAAEFFDAFKNQHADFLAPRYSIRDSAWYWHKTMAPFYSTVYGCSFPITRLSGPAVSHLHELRVELAERVGITQVSLWPNDEAFVSTTLGNATSFTVHDIVATPNVSFKNFSTMIPLLKENFVNVQGVFHPALTWTEFVTKFPDRLTKAISGNRGPTFLRDVLNNLNRQQIVELFIDLANHYDIKLSPKCDERESVANR